MQSQSIMFDAQQANRQLEILGRSPESVKLRFFPKDKGGARKADGLDAAQIISLTEQGWGAYLVVNPGGHRDRDITKCVAIFAEWDDIPIEDQTMLWKEKGMPEPSLQVFSGGKSIHTYWVLDEPISVERWKLLQRDLLDHLDADRSLKNPSRVMRLAGAFHQSGKKSEIVGDSGQRYSFEFLHSIVGGKPIFNISPLEKIDYPVPGAVPLEVALSRLNRERLESGVAQGSRNSAAFELASDAIGVENYLQSSGQNFDGSARHLYDEFVGRCSPPLPKTEAEATWKSAQQSNKGACLSPHKIENCVRSWHWREGGEDRPQSTAAPKAQSTAAPKAKAKPLDIHRELTTIATQNLPESERKIAIAEVADASGLPSRDIWGIYWSIAKELDREDEKGEIQGELDDLLKARQSEIKLSDVLPERLAQPLEQLAKWQNLRPEIYLMSVLAAVSSLHKNGTDITLHSSLDFRVTPNLFVGIVAESSQKKSPILKAAIGDPLRVLHREESERHKQATKDHEKQCNELLEKDKKAELPEKPERRLHYFTRTTGEAILRQASRQPDHGLIYRTDELKALFGSQNAYRRGRGSDQEDLLEFYDGTGGVVLRTEGVRDDVETLNLAICGAVQPPVLDKLVGDEGDGNGKWARFIFVNQPTTAATMPDDGGSIDLTNLLAGIYREIDGLAQMKYVLTDRAFKRFQSIYNELEQRRCQDPSQPMRAVWGKSAGRIGKLALNLHVLEWALTPPEQRHPIPEPEIELKTIEKAIALTNLAAQQIQSLYCQFDDSEDRLAPHFMKVLELAERKGNWIKAKDIQLAFTKSKRPSPDKVRQWFAQLCEMGYGVLEGSGRKLKFRLEPKVDNGRHKVDRVSTVETSTPQVIGETVDKVDTVDGFSPLPDGHQSNTEGKTDTLSTPSTLSTNGSKPVTAGDAAVDESSTKASTAPTKPKTVRDKAGICDRKGNPQTWAVLHCTGNTLKLYLPGMGETKSVRIDQVAPEHLVW